MTVRHAELFQRKEDSYLLITIGDPEIELKSDEKLIKKAPPRILGAGLFLVSLF